MQWVRGTTNLGNNCTSFGAVNPYLYYKLGKYCWIYSVPRLVSIDEKDPDLEHGRKRRIRRLNVELSRYYVPLEGEVEWACSGLLSKGEHDCGQLAL